MKYEKRVTFEKANQVILNNLKDEFLRKSTLKLAVSDTTINDREGA